MKHHLRALGALASIAVAATTFMAPVQAAPTLVLSLAPASDVAFGGAVSVDISVTGLTQAVGGFDFDLNYDVSRMTFSTFFVDPDVKMGDGANPGFDLSLGDAGGAVNLGMLAGFVLPADEATLAGIQGAGFRLGRVEFTALNNAGYAAFGLSGFSLSDYDGNDIRDVSAQGGRLCVSPNGAPGACGGTPMPEPMSALLVAMALGGLGLSRRQATKASA